MVKRVSNLHGRGGRRLLVVAILAGAGVLIFFLFFYTSNADLIDSMKRLRRSAQPEMAAKTAFVLAARNPSDVDSWKLIAETAEAVDDNRLAVTALQRLVELDEAKEADYQLRLAALEMSRNDAFAAGAAIERVLTINPDSASAYRLKSQLTSVLGRTSELTESLIQLIRLKSFTVDDLIVLAASDPFVADNDRLAALSKAHPDDARLLLPRARVAINSDRIPEARELLTQLLKQTPDDWEAQSLLGQILADQGGRDFLTWQSQLPTAADEYSRIWLVRGLWLEKQGETKSAARCFHEALRREPELLTAVTHLGQCLKLNGEHSVAQAYSQRAQLLLKVRDLATRIDNQKNLQWAPDLINSLVALGQYREAWAWGVILLQSDRLNTNLKSLVSQLEQKVDAGKARTDLAGFFGSQLDWSQVPLPDWTQFAAMPSENSEQSSISNIRFADEAESVGVNFVFQSKSPREESGNLIFESTGGGVAVLDFDGDSWPDLFFVQGGDVHNPPRPAPGDTLFRNGRGRKFSELSQMAGVSDDVYGQGAAAGDVNNDGFPDLYVANIGQNRLLMNNGDGTFTDATATAFETPERWTISTAIADLNRDGLPELVDINYCEGREPLTTVCVTEDQKPRACRPTIFEPAPDIHLVSNGDETFAAKDLLSDNASAGGRGMGVVIADFDGDHRTDIFVANDQSPNHLLLNSGETRGEPANFSEQGLVRGVGLDREGFALAFMGIAQGDVNRDGMPDLFVTTFSQETPVLFLSQPGGQFTDSTREAGLRAPCFGMLGFGAQFLDADDDGILDLLILNGHIDQFTDSGQPYEMRPQCFRGLPESRFQELPENNAGEFFQQPRLGRALAVLDWNRDGKQDFVASDLEYSAALCTNASTSVGHAVRVRCIGVLSSRDATGSQVSATAEDARPWIAQVTAGHGYEASNDPCLHIGIGVPDRCQRLEIAWASGANASFSEVASGESWLAVEGRPILYACPK